MNWLTIIKLLLGIVSALIKRADEAAQQEIGRDAEVKRYAVELLEATRTAKKIDDRISRMSDDDIDQFLQSYYRD